MMLQPHRGVHAWHQKHCTPSLAPCRLCFRRVPPYFDQSLKASATAAATRVVKNSGSLTAVDLVCIRSCTSSPLTLSDLLAAGAASGLATRLRQLTSIEVEAACAAQQAQALQQCTGLTHLDISSIGIQECLEVELAAALQAMPRLTRLRVCGYYLRSQHFVSALASAVQYPTQLQHLHLARNVMGIAALAALVPALSAMPALQTLVVDGNNVYPDDRVAWVEALCALLSVVPGLTHLNVANSSLQEEGTALLAPVLRGMTCLQHLDLSHNAVGNRGMAALAPALAALPNLQTLHLSGCGSWDGFMPLLQPLLANAGSPLRRLALCETYFRLEDAQGLAAGLSTAPQLQELNLKYIDMFEGRNEKWMALAPGLSRLGPSLQSLDLRCYFCCNLSAAESAALAAALQPLTGLTRLEAINMFSPATMVAVPPALMGMRQLQVLNLRGNDLKSDVTAAFAEVLPALASSLTHLNLSNCGIDSEAAAGALAPALAQATGLVELHLNSNSFGPRAGQWLPPVLTALPHLRKVHLIACDLGAQGCMAVVRALKDRDGMLVCLGGNGVTIGSAEGNALYSTAGICVVPTM